MPLADDQSANHRRRTRRLATEMTEKAIAEWDPTLVHWSAWKRVKRCWTKSQSMMTPQTGPHPRSLELPASRRSSVSPPRRLISGEIMGRSLPSAQRPMSSSIRSASLSTPDRSKDSTGLQGTSRPLRRRGSGWSRPIRTPTVQRQSTGCGQGTLKRSFGLR